MYLTSRYRSPGPEIEEEAFIENEEAINRATQSPDAKTTRIGVNAAAGLIILPNHLRPSPIPNPPSASASANGFTGDAGDKQPSSANNVVQHHVFPASVRLVLVIMRINKIILKPSLTLPHCFFVHSTPIFNTAGNYKQKDSLHVRFPFL